MCCCLSGLRVEDAGFSQVSYSLNSFKGLYRRLYRGLFEGLFSLGYWGGGGVGATLV